MRTFERNISRLICLFSLIGMPMSAFAHGEDKPGPHGGVIRMPGALHTEVVPSGRQSFKVYLLDLNFKEPTTDKSSLKVTLKKGDHSESLPCSVSGDLFRCSASSANALSSGELIIEANRNGAQGVPITYPLPLTTHSVTQESNEHAHGIRSEKEATNGHK